MAIAVVKTGGKQYVVKKGDIIAIEKLSDETKEGDIVTFDEVLLTDNDTVTSVGAPTVKGAKVSATVTFVGKGKKIQVVKYKPKSRYYKRKGHRQPVMKVKIDSIA